jgi:hypothetical protein
MSSTGIVLAPHTRGDTFPYSTVLQGGWTAEQFSSLKFTIRKKYPASTVVNDGDADVVAQATTANGQIVASGTSVEVTIPASLVTDWPTGKLVWDLQGVLSGSGRVHTIASGVITILPDVTRST